MSHPDAAPGSKSALRAGALARRAAIDSDERAAATHAITARASALIAVLKPRSISGYVAVRSECDPRPILERARANGIIVALPAVIDGKTIVFRTYAEGEALVPAGFGTVAPPPDAPIIQPEMLLVPLVGFDRVGHRLGYGRGHYDRAIAAARADGRRAALVGLAFATQQVERVPAEPHDIPLDWIVTEKETLELRSERI